MDAKVKIVGTEVEGHLTTEHSASSYGQPVLVIGEQAYGPGDLVPKLGGRRAGSFHLDGGPEAVSAILAWRRLCIRFGLVVE